MVKAKHPDTLLDPAYSEIAVRNKIPVWQFEIALRLRPLIKCLAQEAKIAAEEYKKSLKNTEEAMAAMLRWDELTMVLAKAARSLPEIRSAYEISPKGSRPHKFSLEKWVGYIEAIINSLTATPEDCKAAYHDSPNMRGLKEKILTRWNEISILRASRATTREMAKDACLGSPKTGEARRVGLHKWISLCDKEAEIMEVVKLLEKDSEEDPNCPIRNAAILRVIGIHEFTKAEILRKDGLPKN